MVFNKKEFKNLINQLKPIDFNYIGNFGSARFVKKESGRTIIIGIGYNEYFPHSALIRGVLASIYFNDVEEIITKFLEKYQIKRHYGNTTIQDSFVGLNNVDYSKIQMEINNEESFNTVAEEIKKILNFGVMPFFEKFHSLKTVWQETERMPIKEMATFIVQPLPQRRMVIKYLCNDPTYDSYVEWLIEYYKSEKDNGWIEIEKLDLFLKNSS